VRLHADRRPLQCQHLPVHRGAQNNGAKVEHEATTSKIGEDQLFYFASRGIDPEEAVSMIINGFVKDVFTQLPMEFAVEAGRLLGLKLEGSVG
jgi:Fe-S cluster assembly protein SufB